MLQVTKIFRFETAHAIFGYPGLCKNIHGHSYVLHVTVAGQSLSDEPGPGGFILDFKELKHLVNSQVVLLLDHRTILSESYLAEHPSLASLSHVCTWTREPTAENILLYIRDTLKRQLPQGVVLRRLRLFETGDSYAEWEEN